MYTLLEHDYLRLGHVYFYVLGAFLIVDILSSRKINLLHVWIGAFQFIIISEINTSGYFIFYENILTTVKYLMIANNMVILGYYSKSRKLEKANNTELETTSYLKPMALLFMFALSVLYFGYTLPFALKSYVFGRAFAVSESGGGFVASVIGSLAYVLPATYAYYFMTREKPKLIWAIILSLPIWFLLFLIGTRFPLLFSVMGLVIVSLSLKKSKLTIKNYVFIGLSVVLLFLSTIIMKQLRRGFNVEAPTIVQLDESHKSFPQLIGGFGSNELVVDITSKLIEYYEHPNNSHQYGKASSFILYFWIPRAVWPDKPTMVGHWFIRKVEKVSEKHSAALGFTGELFVDFGYFSLFFVFIMGRLLKKSELFFDRCKQSRSFDLVIGAMFYPMIFFFVRSPVTSLMSFIGIFVFYAILKKFFFIKQVKSKQEINLLVNHNTHI